MAMAAAHSIDLHSAGHGFSIDIYLHHGGSITTRVVDTRSSIIPGQQDLPTRTSNHLFRPGPDFIDAVR